MEICFAILWLYSKPEILNSLKSSNNSLGYLLPEKLTHAMSMYMLLSCTNLLTKFEGFPGGSVAKDLPASAEDAKDTGLIPGSGSSPEEGNDNPFQYSCLGNPMDRGAGQATVYGVTKESDTT